jgi:antitoxin VapB
MTEENHDLHQTSAELLAEIEAKRTRLCRRMEESDFDAVQLQRTENIAWLTAGRVDRRVLVPSPLSISTVLLLRGGEAFYIAANNEASRLAEEDFADLPFTAVTVPWHSPDVSIKVASITGGGRVAADIEHEGATLLAGLRSSLCETEIERYHWLGRNTAEVTATVLQSLTPGITERSMVSRTASALLDRNIEPSVLLMAADDRILRYKHAVAQNSRLQHFGMLNLCSRRWGLCISITRFIHFGEMPPRLVDAFHAAAEVNARLLAATREGATAAQLFATAAESYRELGYPGEESLHHQGGATGYGEREWLAAPAGMERVVNHQAFAWNPSVAGGKVEDTVLLRDGHIEWLTSTPELPVVLTRAGSVTVQSAGVLIR